MTMDNLRILFWAGLLILIWLCIQTWQQTFQPRAAAPVADSAPTDTVSAPPAASTGLPTLPGAIPAAAPTATPSVSPVTAAPARLITIKTGVLEAKIDLHGGDLSSVELPTYPVHKDQPNVPLQLLNSQPDEFFALQSGLRAADQQPEANHLAEYTADGT